MPLGTPGQSSNIGSTFMLLILGGLGMGLFGAGYGLVVGLISHDTYEKIKNNLNYILLIDAVLIGLLMLTSLILIKSNPSMFQPYVLIISHVTLLIALLSLSYSVLKITN